MPLTGFPRNRRHCIDRGKEMSRSEEIAKGTKRQQRASNGKPKTPPKGEFRFINVSVTEDMKKRIGAWAKAEGDVWGYVETLAGQGYRLGVSWDGKNDCYSASLTNRDGDERFRQACVTMRGPTAWEAVVRLVGLHFAVANEDWAVLEQPAADYDVW